MAGTRSPFRKHIQMREPDVSRTKRLVASCPGCGKWYSFEGDRMNNGGMFQIEDGADNCPHCGTEPTEVYPLTSEVYTPVGKSRRTPGSVIRPPTPAIEAPAEPEPTPPPSGKVYKRAAQSRNTAGMGMAPVEGTDEE